jgi:hypothetical protein
MANGGHPKPQPPPKPEGPKPAEGEKGSPSQDTPKR